MHARDLWQIRRPGNWQLRLREVNRQQDPSSIATGTWSDGFSQARTCFSIDADEKPVGGFRRQQQMVDADAVVLLPGAGLIVPEGVDAGARR